MAKLRFITHPEVQIDPAVPVSDWTLSPRGRERMRALLKQPWLHVKLAFVGGLLVYHFICQGMMKQMAKGIYKWTSTQLRIWNELATIILFAIVFLVVLKDALSWVYGVVGIVLLSLILMSAVKIYKHYRAKN